MVTCDQNIRYQQNMAERKIALIVLTTTGICSRRTWTGSEVRLTGLDRARSKAWISGSRHAAVLGGQAGRFKAQL
jgi:hypothetical protein